MELKLFPFPRLFFQLHRSEICVQFVFCICDWSEQKVVDWFLLFFLFTKVDHSSATNLDWLCFLAGNWLWVATDIWWSLFLLLSSTLRCRSKERWVKPSSLRGNFISVRLLNYSRQLSLIKSSKYRPASPQEHVQIRSSIPHVLHYSTVCSMWDFFFFIFHKTHEIINFSDSHSNPEGREWFGAKHSG